MNTSDYRLKYVLVGASGTGKTTMAGILEQALGFRRCITSTTRPPRPGEVDGKDYYFRTEFDPRDMFEQATFGKHQYGITHRELTRGEFIILEPQGVRYYREHYPKPLVVIQLHRDNIEIDAQRRARDRDAGFDSVHPDFIVEGDTIDAMATNLLSVITSIEKRDVPRLDLLIERVQNRQAGEGEQQSPRSNKEIKQPEPVR